VHSSGKIHTTRLRADQSLLSASELPPDHIIYELLYRRLALLEDKADLLEKEYKNGSSIRNKIKVDLEIPDYVYVTLKYRALECLDRVDQIDQQAKVIIDATRSSIKDGRLHGKSFIQYPKSLLVLQQQRNEAIGWSITQLQNDIGEQQLFLLDQAVKHNMLANISRKRAK
jgi:hypothetical protein